jgi:hypothetical protein
MIGKTPSHWRKKADRSPTTEEEIFLNLCGALLVHDQATSRGMDRCS